MSTKALGTLARAVEGAAESELLELLGSSSPQATSATDGEPEDRQ